MLVVGAVMDQTAWWVSWGGVGFSALVLDLPCSSLSGGGGWILIN